MFDDIKQDLEERFDAAHQHLAKELSRIRTGRASANLLDEVRVDYYGSATPVNQVATVKVPEPRMITITPWEKNMLAPIERAINGANIGLTPNNDGNMIRLSIPPLTGERRAELAKQARKFGEEAKIAVRGARRDANDMLKSLQKDGDMSEDEMHGHINTVQELTDKAVARVDEIVTTKEQEILEV